jgi:hypothetical protein
MFVARMTEDVTDYGIAAQLESAEAEVRRLRYELAELKAERACYAVVLVKREQELEAERAAHLATSQQVDALVELQSRFGIGAPALGFGASCL